MPEACRTHHTTCGDDAGAVSLGTNDSLTIIFRVLNRRHLIVFKTFSGTCVRFSDTSFL